VGISPSVASPQPTGTSITFTATALGCNTPDYRFFIAPPSTGVFGEVQAFGPTTTFAWNTAGLAPGPYQVGVWSRQRGSTASYEAFAFITFQLQRASAPCTVLDLNTNPQGQLPPKGSTYTIFASAGSGCLSPVYQFYLRSPGSSTFVVVQAYSPSAQFNFATSAASQGAYTVLVLSEDVTSPGPLDTYAETDFKLT
jgi:cell wall-associated protease